MLSVVIWLRGVRKAGFHCSFIQIFMVACQTIFLVRECDLDNILSRDEEIY